MRLLLNFFQNVNDIFHWQGKSLISFAIFTQNIPYLIWEYNDFYSIILILRVLSGFSAGILFFEEHLFHKNKTIKIALWLTALSLCLMVTPLTTYFFNPTSYAWLVNHIISILILPTLLTWQITIFVTIFIFCLIIMVNFFLLAKSINLNHIEILLYHFMYLIFYIFIIARVRDKNSEEKHKIHESISRYVAHELRTPLATLSLANQSISKELNLLDISQNELVSNKSLEHIKSAVLTIENTIRKSNTFINKFIIESMLNFENSERESYLLKNIIFEAVRTYPMSEKQLSLINLNIDNNIYINCDFLILVHVFFNLLKNSLYYIQQQKKGEIFVTTKEDGNNILIIFMDTAKGIEKHKVPSIFRRYYTDRSHGGGLGLAFCKDYINYLGGDITCESEFGQYTRMVIILKKMEE